MFQTYRAVLRGNFLEWIGEGPTQVENEDEVTVEVTILGNGKTEVVKQERGMEMADALGKLAEINALVDIVDPVVWQREMREDRHLPGRDE